MTLHPKVEEALQEIDAAFFSGDAFYYRSNRDRIRKFLDRWNKAVENLDNDSYLDYDKDEYND